MKLHIRFLLLCCLFIAKSVTAVEVEGLFTADVTTHSHSREDRNIALREALLKVISRLTVGKEFTQNSAVKSALENAASYVDHYQYVQVSSETGKKSPLVLQVTFNKNTLMELMHRSGLVVWDENRDKTLVWLVIEQRGKTSFLDIKQHAELGVALQGAAMARGIPLLFPLMDLEEKQAISVKDILASNPDKILAASERYDVATILSGKLIKSRTCWRSKWALHFNNKTEHWTVPCTNLKANLTSVLQRVYQQLSVFYAVKAGQAVN